MKKRLTRKRLVLLILLAIIYTLATALSFYIGVKLDPYGEKPYIVLPTVLTGIVFMVLLAFTLLKIYPYANEYDKKKLEKKTLKNKTFQTNIDGLKNLLSNNFATLLIFDYFIKIFQKIKNNQNKNQKCMI